MERNGQRYAYESISVRVPGKKNPRTIKTYLGRLGPNTWKIIPKDPRKRPEEEYAKFYGTVQALDGIQRQMGLLGDWIRVRRDGTQYHGRRDGPDRSIRHGHSPLYC